MREAVQEFHSSGRSKRETAPFGIAFGSMKTENRELVEKVAAATPKWRERAACGDNRRSIVASGK